jgi:hypothetical protein
MPLFFSPKRPFVYAHKPNTYIDRLPKKGIHTGLIIVSMIGWLISFMLPFGVAPDALIPVVFGGLEQGAIPLEEVLGLPPLLMMIGILLTYVIYTGAIVLLAWFISRLSKTTSKKQCIKIINLYLYTDAIHLGLRAYMTILAYLISFQGSVPADLFDLSYTLVSLGTMILFVYGLIRINIKSRQS